MSETDLLNTSAHGGGLNLCGLAPKTRLTTVMTKWECHNCGEHQMVRCFSGSGWYEDEAICFACGESDTGYRPFEPAWRKKNMKRAAEWLESAVPEDEYFARTGAAVKSEMGWDDPKEHEFRTFNEDDVCDLCEQGSAAHAD